MATNHAVTVEQSRLQRVFQRALLWCLFVVVVIVSVSTATLSHAQHANLSREQLAILLMLLKTSSFEDESSSTDPETALLQQYQKNIAQHVVGAACVNCHVSGGLAGSTRLILSPGDDEANLAAIRAFNSLVGDDGDTLLAKMSGGLQHGGGLQFASSSSEYAAMRELFYAIYPAPDPLEFYIANVKQPVVQAVCSNCHKSDGLAASTQLRFSLSDDAANVEAIRNYIQLRGDGGQTILSKISGGQSHGGSSPFPTDSSGYAAMAELINILNRSTTDSGENTGNGFFKDVTVASAEQTLRRAALILAGRLPTAEEVTLAKSDEDGLRQAVLGLMQGDGFHQFLLRGANDRLHTDAFLNGLFSEVTDLFGVGGTFYPVAANKNFLPKPFTDEQNWERDQWATGYRVGVTRAPLELIAYIVENDRPYTEVLTADYTMVNWYSSQAFRSGTRVGTSGDATTFAPGPNRGQVVLDDEYENQWVQDSGLRVLSHSGFLDYPHAGIMNEPIWLHRYPTTETNRNRARARWTFYHFLGIDIETSAPRTTDPVALADTNNPTLNNPACTVCHSRLDPLAGAYQNYGNEGIYRSAWGGLDALPDTYKYPEWFEENSDPSPYQHGDTWFRDMLPPGFADTTQPNDRKDDSLQWLGQVMVNDPRFAKAAVSFWWPALIGAETLASPEVETDANYQQLSAAFDAQQRDIGIFADQFRDNNFNLKSLLADMVLSPWFRAKGLEAATDRAVELANVGIDRLLTPEELDAKNVAILGYTWDRYENDWIGNPNRYGSALTGRLNLYYGGIDSNGIKERSRAMTALMANVAERNGLHLACGVTTLDFFENTKPEDRRLFDISPIITPLTEITRSVSVDIGTLGTATSYDVATTLSAGTKELLINFTNDAYDEDTGADRNLYIDAVEIYQGDTLIDTIEAEDFPDTQGFSQTTYSDGDVMGDVHWDEVDGNWQPAAWILWSDGYVGIRVELPADGYYRFRIKAWGSDVGDGVASDMTVTVAGISIDELTRGALAIKNQIRSLHHKLLGDDLPIDDPEIEAVYELLLETWQDRKTHEYNNWAWYWQEEECLFPREILQEEWDEGVGSDPQQMLYTWASVVYYYLTHFDYLHE